MRVRTSRGVLLAAAALTGAYVLFTLPLLETPKMIHGPAINRSSQNKTIVMWTKFFGNKIHPERYLVSCPKLTLNLFWETSGDCRK